MAVESFQTAVAAEVPKMMPAAVVATVPLVVPAMDVPDIVSRCIEAAHERDRLRQARRRERERESRESTSLDHARVHKQSQRERDAAV